MVNLLHKPTISVILPCHNNSDYLGLVLESIQNQSSLAEEVICVDDSSSQSEFRKIQRICSQFKVSLLRLPENREEFGRRSMARNYGTRVAKCDICLYLDGDMLIGPDYIQEIRFLHALNNGIMIKGKRYSLPLNEQLRGTQHCFELVTEHRIQSEVQDDIYRVSPQHAITLDANSGILLASATIAGHLKDKRISRRKFLFTLGCLLIHPMFGYDKRLYSKIQYSSRWDFCASNNLSVRRTYVEKIGYWDENFVGWGEEDIDFAYRLYIMGVLPVVPEDGPVYAYHLDHEIDSERNHLSLDRNARYFVRKFPDMQLYRKETYTHYKIDL